MIGIAMALVFSFREFLLYRIGTFLAVDQPFERADAVVASKITEKIAELYRDGRCGKIVLAIRDDNGNWWKFLPKSDSMEGARGKAEKWGIRRDDLIVFDRTLENRDDISYFNSLKKLLRENGIHSAVFYSPYYKTRRKRFYLDRYLDGPGIESYVVSAEENYLPRFERWWENTALDNLFMDEYLKIAFYYFNKFLWSPAV